ncbi:hypothetical protein [Dietzia sp. B32]|uniref:hypothetical protein n=1 Tax=Dietzia sp. B32 TaxID=2915130 RepID=UPI0021AE0227|nr:hypothetical protein [Dietzia sp. B32]UVE96631.1 hypothetical protein L8M95_07685 [Dietzia sp. B32]
MRESVKRPKILAAIVAASLCLGFIGLPQATMTTAALTDSANATSQNLATASDLLPRPDEITCNNYENLNWAGIRFAVKKKRPEQRYRMYIVQDNGDVRRLGSNGPYSWSPQGQFPYPDDWVTFDRLTNDQLGSNTSGWHFTAKIYSVNPAGEESDNWIGWYFSHSSLLIYRCTTDGAQQRSGNGPPGNIPADFTNEAKHDEFVSLAGKPTPSELAGDLSAEKSPYPEDPIDAAQPTTSPAASVSESLARSTKSPSPTTTVSTGQRDNSTSSTFPTASINASPKRSPASRPTPATTTPPATQVTTSTSAAPAIVIPDEPAPLSPAARIEDVGTVEVGGEDLVVVVPGDTVPTGTRTALPALETWINDGRQPSGDWTTFTSTDPDSDGWRWAAINGTTGAVVYIR